MKRIIRGSLCESKNLITPEVARGLLDYSIPFSIYSREGFYLHGRNGERGFGEPPYPFQFTSRMDIAQAYSNFDKYESNSKIYMVRPRKSAETFDFIRDSSKDLQGFIEAMQNVAESIVMAGIGNYPISELAYDFDDWLKDYFREDVNEDNLDRLKDWIESVITDAFRPMDIVENAEAYDDYDWWKFLSVLYDYNEDFPDFVKLPYGNAVMFPTEKVLDRMEYYELIDLAEEAG
jgi:hypothetical protein